MQKTAHGNGSDEQSSDSAPQLPHSKTSQQEKNVAEALASLQLPHMPLSSQSTLSSSTTDVKQCDLPSIRILVCADLDLHSTSALAEYILQQNRFDATLIDLIIAAGPFVRYDDLAHYSSSHRNRPKYTVHRRPVHSFRDTYTDDDATISRLVPFFHTREETAALEGLMTAALSQLESIVCRVVYCPGYSDPLTTVTANKRLTPNSRNIHRQWLPLAPGLGCAGMFYIDGAEELINLGNNVSRPVQQQQQPQVSTPATNATSAYEAEDESSEEEDSMAIFSEHLNQMRQSSSGYCNTLSKLVKLAPKLEHPMAQLRPELDEKCQSILVTHYVDSQSLLQQEELLFGDDENAFDDLHPEAKEETSGLDWEKPHGIVHESSGVYLPWPADHASFLNAADTKKNLCLEIASGSAPHHRSAWINDKGQLYSSEDVTTIQLQTKTSSVVTKSLHNRPVEGLHKNEVNTSNGSSTGGPVLFPGSLRERGEFCIMHFTLSESMTMTKTYSAPQFTWQVDKVDFYNVND